LAAVARRHGIEPVFMNIDLAAYELIQNPANFDVIAAPQSFRRHPGRRCGVLVFITRRDFLRQFRCAQRPRCYQPTMVAPHDLADTDIANPAGQILSLAMLLRESFGLDEAPRLSKNPSPQSGARVGAPPTSPSRVPDSGHESHGRQGCRTGSSFGGNSAACMKPALLLR